MENKNHDKLGWGASLKAGTIAFGLSIFLASPPFGSWSWVNIAQSRAGDFLKLCENPLARSLAEPILAYRVTVPTIAWLLHLPAVLSLALASIFAWGALVVLHQAVLRRVGSRVAMYAALGIACSSAMRFPIGLLGVPDSFSHLATAAMLICRPGLVPIAIIVGGMNDERIVLALPFIIIWRWSEFKENGELAWVSLVKIRRFLFAIASGVFALLVLRHALRVGWLGSGIETPSVYVEIATCFSNRQPRLGSWGVWFVNCLNGLGWLWIPILISGWAAFSGGKTKRLLFFQLPILFACVSTLGVADVSRSIGYFYPAVLVGFLFVRDDYPALASRLITISVVLQLATPGLWIYERMQTILFRPFIWEFWLFIHSLDRILG